LRLFEESNALLHGHFKLTSGKHSEWYFEKIKLIERPVVLEKSSTCWLNRSSRIIYPSIMLSLQLMAELPSVF